VISILDEHRRRERERVRRERRYTKVLVDAVAAGDAGIFFEFGLPCDNPIIDWRLAKREIARLGSVSAEIREAFVATWVQHKGLAQKVDRRVLAAGLRVLLLPKASDPPGLPAGC
jgi:hypothetical protein